MKVDETLKLSLYKVANNNRVRVIPIDKRWWENLTFSNCWISSTYLVICLTRRLQFECYMSNLFTETSTALDWAGYQPCQVEGYDNYNKFCL